MSAKFSVELECRIRRNESMFDCVGYCESNMILSSSWRFDSIFACIRLVACIYACLNMPLKKHGHHNECRPNSTYSVDFKINVST
jgi:hypothetical protein